MARIKILLVDDEEDFRFIFTRQVTRILHDLELEFFEAGDGEEALQLLRTGIRPSIIILDYTMPRMSGTELLRAIDREHGDLLDVPRVVLSGFIGEDAVREVHGLRCDYIEKSMNTKIFYQQFCRYLSEKLGLSRTHAPE
ncbi:MAG TPA: response regulator [Smithellaceae bacterium]|nr:response regulator [Smithellaceae bacterium]HRS83428.1 response regulator [Smithellaceae bacterium]HRV45556.1 response regulator [Smithellaceae bacterium]